MVGRRRGSGDCGRQLGGRGQAHEGGVAAPRRVAVGETGARLLGQELECAAPALLVGVEARHRSWRVVGSERAVDLLLVVVLLVLLVLEAVVRVAQAGRLLRLVADLRLGDQLTQAGRLAVAATRGARAHLEELRVGVRLRLDELGGRDVGQEAGPELVLRQLVGARLEGQARGGLLAGRRELAIRVGLLAGRLAGRLGGALAPRRRPTRLDGLAEAGRQAVRRLEVRAVVAAGAAELLLDGAARVRVAVGQGRGRGRAGRRLVSHVIVEAQAQVLVEGHVGRLAAAVQAERLLAGAHGALGLRLVPDRVEVGAHVGRGRPIAVGGGGGAVLLSRGRRPLAAGRLVSIIIVGELGRPARRAGGGPLAGLPVALDVELVVHVVRLAGRVELGAARPLQLGLLVGAGARRARLVLVVALALAARRAAGAALPGAAVEQRLDVLPRVLGVLRVVERPVQVDVLAPAVDVGRVGRVALVRAHGLLVRVEDELVGREEVAAVEALDALGARADVARGHEAAAAAEVDLVRDGEVEVVGQLGRLLVDQERAAQALGLAHRDHAAAPRRAGHGARAPQHLQLDGRALDTGDAERHAPVVDLVVAELLEQRVAYLRQTQPLASIDHQGHDLQAEQLDLLDVVLAGGRRLGQAGALLLVAARLELVGADGRAGRRGRGGRWPGLADCRRLLAALAVGIAAVGRRGGGGGRRVVGGGVARARVVGLDVDSGRPGRRAGGRGRGAGLAPDRQLQLVQLADRALPLDGPSRLVHLVGRLVLAVCCSPLPIDTVVRCEMRVACRRLSVRVSLVLLLVWILVSILILILICSIHLNLIGHRLLVRS